MSRIAQRFLHILAVSVLLALPPTGRAAAPDARLEAAVRLYREEGAQKALPMFENLAATFARSASARDQAAALTYVGECHWRLGNFRESRQALQRALALERGAGDRPGEGRTLNVRGLLAWDEGNYEQAIADFRRAGELARAASDRKLEGSALNNLSLVYDEQGDYDTSLAQYRRVLELYRGADFPRGVGDTLGNIGGVHLLLGHYREAFDYYRQALAISEQLRSKPSMSQDHGNLGLCLLGLGDIDAALVHFDQAIELAAQAGMRQDQAYWRRAKGDGLVQKGRYDLGMLEYRAALGTYEEIGAQAEVLEALHASGQLHLTLGDAASAERDFERALAMARSIGLDRGITSNLIALGDLEFRRGRPDAALALYEQARQRAATAKAQPALGSSLLRLARVNRSLQRLEAAAAQTDQALRIARLVGAPRLEGEARFAQAELDRLNGRLGAALRHFDAAESTAAHLGDPDLLWQIYYGRGRTQEASGDVPGALASLEAAVRLIEGVRGRLRESRFRAGYVEDKFEVYLELMRLQLQQGRSSEAFSTAERLRTQSFIEQLGGRTLVPLNATDRRREAELRERVRQLQDSLDDTNEEGLPAYPERAMSRFSEELQRAEREYQAFLDDHAGVHEGSVGAPTAATVQSRLAPDQALIEYVVAPDSIVIFVLTPRRIGVKSMPLRAADIEARVSLLRDMIRRPGEDRWRKPAARLSADLLDPLEQAGWLAGVKHLYVVPHGALTYLPFALLPRSTGEDSDGLLIDRYTVAYLPAATALLREPQARGLGRTLLAVAPSRGRLRHTTEEARAVDALFQPHARMLLGPEATEGRFKQLAGDFRVLHLATHGYFNEASPLLSGLEFEPDRREDGMLRVHEILDLDLRADLVTLSACDTALGSGYFSELPAGDEFVGLNRAFLAAGSASVMATLWQVDDRASVSLMRQFYGRLSQAGDDRNAASALAGAQRDLRHSPRLSHPYYWAAYVVVGRVDWNPQAEKSSPGRTS